MELELRGITKQFPGVLANDDVSLTARSGKVLALIGENGAGKSTLMNVLSGLYTPDSGEIVIDGVVQRFGDPGDAIKAGIGMVHQHFMLVPVFSVWENVVLGVEPVKGLGDHEPQGGAHGGRARSQSATAWPSTPTPSWRTSPSGSSSGSRSSRSCCGAPRSWCSTSPPRC